jgi:hypothetical protein
MLIIWSDTKRGGALNATVGFGEVRVDAFAPAPKKALESMSPHNRPASCAFCLKASAES